MKHPADKLRKNLKIVFLAYSKKNFYWRQHLSKIALDEMNCIPINPFMSFDYFLLDTVDRNRIRLANNNLIKRVDELWVIGEISDGVQAEIRLAEKLKKPIKYFSIEDLPDRLKETKRENLKTEN